MEMGINELFGEAIINILPVYKEENFQSKREKMSEEDLTKLQVKLTLPPEPGKAKTEVIKKEPEETKVIEKPKKKRKTPIKKLPKAPKRIP